MADLQASIEELWERRAELSPADTEAAALVEEAIELLDTGQARVAEVDAATDEVVVHEWLKKSILLLFSLRGMETIEARAVRVRRQASPQARFRRGRRARPPRGLGPLGLLPRARRRPHAVVREHRRLGRCGFHGRHLGHRRLLRADRRAGPPGGRGGHRRRARAAQRRARGSRGRRLRREPLHGDGRGAHRQGCGAGCGQLPRPLHPRDRCRDRRGDLPRRRALVVRGHPRQPAA